MNEIVITSGPLPSFPPILRTEFSVESILLDSELFVKYKSAERAVALLQESIERSPRSIPLREKLREVCGTNGDIAEAARQCLALANLYIDREEFQSAYDRLQEAKLLDPRISIAPGLEAIRRARHPQFSQPQTVAVPPTPVSIRTDAALAGNLSLVGLFDVIQAVENSRLTGLLTLKSDLQIATLAFNNGSIVDAESNGDNGERAFRRIVEITGGTFEFVTSEREFPVVIFGSNNTNLLLDTLADMDVENR